MPLVRFTHDSQRMYSRAPHRVVHKLFIIQFVQILCKLLSPLVGNTEFTVKDSYEFVQFLNSILLKKNERMVSFDVV